MQLVYRLSQYTLLRRHQCQVPKVCVYILPNYLNCLSETCFLDINHSLHIHEVHSIHNAWNPQCNILITMASPSTYPVTDTGAFFCKLCKYKNLSIFSNEVNSFLVGEFYFRAKYFLSHHPSKNWLLS